MKAFFAFLLVSTSLSQAFADGVLSCSGINQDSHQREDVLYVEADLAILHTETGDSRFLSVIGQKGNAMTYSNSKVHVAVDGQARTITTTQRSDGSSKVHTEVKCTGTGDDME